jgi:hypothetical protein
MTSKHEMPSTQIDLTPEHRNRLFFAEELDILKIHSNRIFRQAVELDADMPDEFPDVEAEVAEEFGQEDLEQAVAELDEAKAGEDPVTAEIAKWREELEAAAV